MLTLVWMFFIDYLVINSYIRVKKLEILTHDFMREVAESLRKQKQNFEKEEKENEQKS